MEGFYLNINDGTNDSRFNFLDGFAVSNTSESYLEWDVLETPFADVGSGSTVTIVNG